jgi:hypothetical protein
VYFVQSAYRDKLSVSLCVFVRRFSLAQRADRGNSSESAHRRVML